MESQLRPSIASSMSTIESRLEALKRRRSELDDALRAEREKRKAIEKRERDRLVSIVGRAALANAAQSPEFKQFLIGVLRTTVTLDSEVKFLITLHWW